MIVVWFQPPIATQISTLRPNSAGNVTDWATKPPRTHTGHTSSCRGNPPETALDTPRSYRKKTTWKELKRDLRCTSSSSFTTILYISCFLLSSVRHDASIPWKMLPGGLSAIFGNITLRKSQPHDQVIGHWQLTLFWGHWQWLFFSIPLNKRNDDAQHDAVCFFEWPKRPKSERNWHRCGFLCI